MQSKLTCSLMALTFSLVAASLAPSVARAEDPVAEWAPEDALLFLGVPSYKSLADNFKKTQQYRSLDDPALSKQLQPFKKLMENARNYIARQIGLENPSELDIEPQGGIAAFVQFDPAASEDGDETRLCLIAETGEQVDRVRALAAKVVQHCMQKGGQRSTDEVGGVEITTIQFKPADGQDEDEADESSGLESLLEGVELDDMQMMLVSGFLSEVEAPERFAFAFAGSRLVVGSDAAVVKDTIIRLRRGADGSMAGLRDLRAFARRDSGKPDALAVVNLPVLIKKLAEEDDDSKKMVAALSADALGPILLTVQLVPSSEVEMRLRGFMRVDERPHGLGRILMMQNMDTAPPPGVSADTAVYVSVNLNPTLILDEVFAITEQIDSDAAEQMRGSMSIPQEDGTALDIKNDVIGKLAGPLTFAINLAAPFDAEHINMILRLGHKSRDAMSKLAAMLPAGMFEPAEMLGHSIYTTPMLAGLAMGFTERSLIPFATHKALESYIRSEGESGRGLAQTPGFQRCVRHVPAQSCMMVYMNGPLMADAQIALAEAEPELPEEGEVSLSHYIRWGISQGMAGQDIDLLKAARKYQGSFILTLSAESDGLLLDAVQLPADRGSGD